MRAGPLDVIENAVRELEKHGVHTEAEGQLGAIRHAVKLLRLAPSGETYVLSGQPHSGNQLVAIYRQSAEAEPAPEDKNEYRPWESMGITELAYWKQRYIEARQELGALTEPAPVVEPVAWGVVEREASGRIVRMALNELWPSRAAFLESGRTYQVRPGHTYTVEPVGAHPPTDTGETEALEAIRDVVTLLRMGGYDESGKHYPVGRGGLTAQGCRSEADILDSTLARLTTQGGSDR